MNKLDLRKPISIIMRVFLFLQFFLIFGFTQAQVPTVTYFLPTNGSVGASVTISGTNFDITPINNIVYFGAFKATVNSASETELVVEVPYGATHDPISVIKGGYYAESDEPFSVSFEGPDAISNNLFESEPSLTTTSGGLSTALGDFDLDGKIDLAVANNGGSTVSIYLNTSLPSGEITYASKQDFGVGTQPTFVLATDVDLDGKLDLVVSNRDDNSISILINNSTVVGTISFAAKVDFATANDPFCIAKGDLDKDGKPDLVVANFESSSISVLRNNSSGSSISFESKQDVSTDAFPYSVALHDLDGDGYLDVVVDGNNSTLSILRNTTSSAGNITFDSRLDLTAGEITRVMGVADFDSDGKPDIAITAQTIDAVYIFRNTTSSVGSISFDAGTSFTTSAGPIALEIADLDGDGKEDLVTSNISGASVSVFQNTSSGIGNIDFGERVDFSTQINPQSAAVGDMNQDGLPDMVVVNEGSSTVSVFKHLGTNLIAHYTFDGNAIDQSGNGNDGTESGGVTYITDRFGNAGGGASFDGSDDYINGTSVQDLGFSDFTMSVWVQPQEVSEEGIFSTRRNSSGIGYSLMKTALNGFAFHLGNQTSSEGLVSTDFAGSNTYELDQWAHVVGVKDGSTMLIYVDGVLAGTRSTSLTIDSNFDFVIGRQMTDASFEYFTGGIDDMRLFNSALSTSEIEALYEEGNTIDNTNFTFEDPPILITSTHAQSFDGGRIKAFDQSLVPGWNTTASDGRIEFWHETNTIINIDAYSGDQWVDLNGNEVAALYTDISTIPGDVVSWSFAHRGRSGTDGAKLSAGSADGSLVEIANVSTDNTGWVKYEGDYEIPQGQTTTRFQFEAVSTSSGGLSVGNFLDSFTIDLTESSETAITGFTITNQLEGETIADGTITVTMPYGTEVASLVPTIVLSNGATVIPDSGVGQDFTSAVTYTVTAQDGTTQDWTVTVSVDDGLVAHYTFDGDATDQSGNGNDGTENGGVTYTTDRFGNASGAVSFDGVDDYIETSFDFANTFSVGDPYSVSIWIKGDMQSETSYVFASNEGGPDHYIYFNSGEVVGNTQSYSSGILSTDDPILNLNWHFMVFGSDGANTFMYVDGVIQSQSNANGINNRNNTTIFGARRSGSIINHFTGLLDDISIYNRALLESEIFDLYAENYYHPGFTEVSSSFVDVGYSRQTIMDIDNDNDFDIAYTGRTSGANVYFDYYLNQSGSFQAQNLMNGETTVWDYSRPAIAANDLNNDEMIDLLFSVNLSSARLYLNENGSFNQYSSPFSEAVNRGSIEISDYDNDGFTDVLLTGYSNSRLYDWNGSEYTLEEEPFIEVFASDAVFGDLDNDGDQDLIIAGVLDGGEYTYKVYENIDFEYFEKSTISLDNSGFDGVIELVDADSDGDLDLFFAMDNLNIYLNSEFNFALHSVIGSLYEGDLAVGDIDNNGAIDFAFTGGDNTSLHMNYFTDSSYVSNSVTNANFQLRKSSIDFFDSDLDGDLDVFLTGELTSQTNPQSILLLNESLKENTAPQSPTSLQASVSANGDISFSWDTAIDNETSSLGLSYDVYVGTASGVYNRTPGKADPTTGFRRIVERGSLQTTFWNMRGLENGTYYWSVQAVDGGFMGSPFATEGTFTIDVSAPSAPEALAPSDEAANSFTANWEIAEDISSYFLDVASDADFIDFVEGYEGRELYGIDSLSITGVSSDTVYYYRIQAENAGGISDYSNVISVNNILSITSLDQYSGAPGDVLTVIGTGFATETFYNSVSIGDVEAIVTDVNTDGTELSFSIPEGALDNTLITLSSFGQTTDAPQNFSLLAYTSPTGLTVSLSGTTASLTWDVHPDAAITLYNIYRDINPDPTTFLANSAASNYEDAGLSEGTNYYYRITATDGSNESGYSNEVSVAVQNSNGTDVSGNLIESDTWTIAGSPYNIVGDVGVPAGFSLTIEPGVVVNYTGDFRILVFGSILVNGNESNPVSFNGNATEGSKYMLEIRKTNLDNSNIDYAVMVGPQGALLGGTIEDSEQNTGDLNVTGTKVSDSRITISPFAGGTNPSELSTLTFSKSNIIGSVLDGTRVTYELYTFVFKTGVISNSEIDGLNFDLSGSTLINTAFTSSIDWTQISNSTLFESGFLSSNPGLSIGDINLRKSKISNSKLINSPLEVKNIDVSNSVLAMHSYDSSLVYLNGNGYGNSSISNVSLVSGRNSNGLFNGDHNFSLDNSTFNGFQVALFQRAGSEEQVVLQSNNFLNSNIYHVENRSIGDISAQSNYWDSNSATTIASKIYDSGDDLELGTVDFSNRLTTHNLAAPISSPQNVVLSDDGTGGVDVSWSANEEADVEGYKLYYRAEIGNIWYLADHTTIDVGNVTTYNISGLTISDSVAVTAYDSDIDGIRDMTDGNESWYSFAVTPPDTPVAAEVDSITVSSFLAIWSVVNDAAAYRLDVATDDQFTNILSGFNNLEVLDTAQIVTGLTPNTVYYFRVRSENAAGVSVSSNYEILTTLFFSEVFVGSLEGVNQSSVDWGDYDKDGDLDILLSGQSRFDGFISKIYQNTMNGFNEVFEGQLEGLINSSAEWGDYDGDGYLDILITGRNSSSEAVSRIYNNDGTGFSEVFSGKLDGVAESQTKWGDFDNDGDLDILLTGDDGTKYSSKIYENIGNDFEEVFSGQLDEIRGAAAWADYDNDGDLDISLSGFIANNISLVSKVYENTSSRFNEVFSGQLEGLFAGDLAWNDYNTDSRLDLLISGASELTGGDVNFSKIYKNNGVDFVEVFNNQLTGVANSSTDWGDFDGDGDSDIIISGYNNSVASSKIYENTSSGFNEVFLGQIEQVALGDLGVADYDNDGDLDILISGEISNNFVSKIYENQSPILNTIPTPPSNLSTSISTFQVNFSWDKATDAETPQSGLNYNIYIGTESGTQNIRPAHADLTNGFRRIVKRGDIQGHSWFIKGLAPGTYYWSVQAIDASYAGGAFAEEQSFTVTNTQSSEKLITSFTVPNQIGSSVINEVALTVTLDIPSTENIESLVPTIQVSAGATISPESGIATDFTNPVTYTVTAEDATTVEWIVTVAQQNSAPTISDQTFTIDENSSQGTVIDTVQASDSDVGDVLSYSIVAGNIDEAFVISSSLGELTVNTASVLDFETNPTFSLTVEVSDGEATNSATITINLNDLDDTNEFPEDIQLTSTSVFENAVIGVTVGTFSTIDNDPIDSHTYSLVSGEGDDNNSSFRIDNDKLETLETFDFETKSSYSIRVQTEDADGASYSESFTISVIDIDESALIAFYPFNGDVSDGSNNNNDGVINGATLTADRFGNLESAFNFNGANQGLDFANQSYLAPRTGDYTFNAWVKFSSDSEDQHIFEINGSSGESVPYIRLTSPTGGDEIYFSLQSGDASTLAEVSYTGLKDDQWHMVTGVRKDQFNVLLYIDGELAGSTSNNNLGDIDTNVAGYILRVGYSPGFGGIFTKGQIDDIRIYNTALSQTEIQDIYTEGGWPLNQSPIISNQTFSIDENSQISTLVGTVVASDSDQDALAFSIVTGNTNNAFEIGSFTGEITVANQSALDFETTPTFSLSVDVTDGDAISSATITINLNDIDENSAPVILNQTFDIDENSSLDTVVGSILATDADEDVLTYMVISGNTNDAFSVNSSTGEITVAKQSALDFEETSTFSLVIEVTDENDDSADAVITINVADVDDPAIITPLVTNPLEYRLSSGGFTVGTEVEDQDGISEVWIDFKKASQANYESSQLTANGDNQYTYSMDDSNIDNVGVQYRFRCIDLSSNTAETLPFVTYTLVADDAKVVATAGGAGTTVKNYSIIAFPFDDPNADELLSELGEYNAQDWRMYRFNNSSSAYQEYKTFNGVTPGEGYWFILKEATEINMGGRTVDIVDGAFQIDLASGFNMIGNPFQGTLDWDAVVQHNVEQGIISISDIDNANQSDVYAWNTAYVTKSTLNEFEGGFVKTNIAITNFEIPLSALSGAGGRMSFSLPTSRAISVDETTWDLNFYFKTPSYDYYLGGIGVNQDASDQLDAYDRELLPRFSLYLDMVFDDGSTKSVKNFEQFKHWEFTVPNNLDEEYLDLSWDVPVSSDKTVMLIDGSSRKLYDLKEVNNIRLLNKQSSVHQLYFGSKDEIYANVDLPFDILFEWYPNPVSDVLNIGVYSSEDKYANIELISIDGKSVYLNTQNLSKGLNKVRLSISEMSIPEGIYFLKLDNRIMTKLIKQ